MRRCVPLLAVLLSTGCGVSPAALGVGWGDGPSGAAAKLGVKCQWSSTSVGEGFETCEDLDTKVAVFGESASFTLVRQGDQLEGVSVRFWGCEAKRRVLRARIRSEFHLEGGADEDPYVTMVDDSLVHLSYDGGDDTCTLTVAGPRYGKAFAADLLGRGLRGLFIFH